ncbi:MAG: TonB-dependent receptor, partial [Saprospiraceae bacterium]|nr:TonB-dependent receptor [Saprospiraceae bacterium]
VDLPYLQPEKMQVFEVGYKSVLQNRLYIDINVYHSRYQDFIAQQTVRLKSGTSHQGIPLAGVDDDPLNAAAFRLYVNSRSTVTSTGAGIGLDYRFFRSYHVHGHYTYTTYSANGEDPDFDAGFNMPGHIALIGIRNGELGRFGFGMHYRWQSGFDWEGSFTYGPVEAIGTLDGHVMHRLGASGVALKVGATNLLGTNFRNIAGGPQIGRTVFVGMTCGLK